MDPVWFAAPRIGHGKIEEAHAEQRQREAEASGHKRQQHAFTNKAKRAILAEGQPAVAAE